MVFEKSVTGYFHVFSCRKYKINKCIKHSEQTPSTTTSSARSKKSQRNHGVIRGFKFVSLLLQIYARKEYFQSLHFF